MKKTKPRDINELISTKSLQNDSKVQLLEAEMLHRSHEIQNFDRLKYALTRDGEDHTSAFKRLAAARDQLDERLRALRKPPADALKGDSTQISLDFPHTELVAPRLGLTGEGGFVFGTEGFVAVPRATNGISVVPSSPSAHGEIVTTQLGPQCAVYFRAENGFDGNISLSVNPPTQAAQIWSRNWQYVVLFPCVPTASFLTYKFQVNVVAQLWGFGPLKGTIASFVSVGEAPGVSPNSGINVDTPVGFPLIKNLESPAGFFGPSPGSLDVERTFAVGAHQTPAVAINVGFVVLLTDGVLFLTSFPNVSSRIGIADCAVRYRYTPIPVHTSA